MKVILQDNNEYILSCAKGEEIIQELTRFCEEGSIEAAKFTIIGAINEVELAWYDVHNKKYETKTLKEDLEIAGLFGNIAVMDGNTMVHNHGVFSDRDMKVYGGHVNKAVVAAACEGMLTKLIGKIERKYSEEIGLNLMD